MKELQTIRGITFLVDDEDYEKAKQYRWTINTSGHVITTSTNGSTYKQIILDTHGKFTLYKNKNPLDLRRDNILVFDTQKECTMVQNKMYKKKEFDAELSLLSHCRTDRTRKKSEYIGISYMKTLRSWLSKITYKGKKYNLGNFISAESAALAHDKKALELYGTNARRNFPNLTLEELTEKLNRIKAEDDFLSTDNFSRQIQGKISPKREKKKTSVYVGVSYSRSSEKWVACICRYRKHYSLGSFHKEEDAARAYDKKALELYGENAKLNFPLE